MASTFNEQLLSQHLLDQGATTSRSGRICINREIDDIRAHDHPPDDVRRVREDHARPGREGRAADGRRASRRVPQAAGGLLRPRFRRSTTSSSWSACASRTSTGRSTSTSTPPAFRPRSPCRSACSSGGTAELSDYLSFLKGGCSKYPLDLLRTPAWTCPSPPPVDAAMRRFGEMVEELDSILS